MGKVMKRRKDMKTSTELNSVARIVGEEKGVELIARAGFDAWDFSLTNMWNCDWNAHTYTFTDHPLAKPDYLDFARRLRRIGEDNGIVCNQSHAPFPCYAQDFADTEKFLKRSIECTAEAGGEICVIHPSAFDGPEVNAEMYLKLLPFAKEHGVKIATENMWGWNVELDQALAIACSRHDTFKAQMDALVDEFFVACLDFGHAEMKGLDTSSVQIIHALGDRLEALHIHDIDLKHDNHQIPFSMNIDFEPIAKALRDIGYKGWFTLEAVRYLDKFDESNVFEGVVNLHTAADKFEKMVLKGE